MAKKQELFGGVIAGKALDRVLDRALDAIVKSPAISVDKPVAEAVKEIVMVEAAKDVIAPDKGMVPVTRWYKSTGIWFGLFSIATALGITGITIDFQTGDFEGNIYTLGASITALLQGVGLIFGRMKTATRIG